MKKIRPYLIIITCLICVHAYSQRNKAILVFKDGTKIEGLAKINRAGIIKFRKAKGEKRVKYSFETLQYATLYDRDGGNTYFRLKVKGQSSPEILQRMQSGKVSLYKINTSGVNTMMMGGGAGGGFGAPMVMTTPYSINDYYVKKEGEEAVTHLGSTQLFSKNFKKAASDYFADCPVLVEKIQQREFKKKDIEAIVRFYNSQCTIMK
ncbi:hypothetical protein [Aquimarina brevivitae]|uniref:Uncharacterized protein n=1 Tax=Aquimarina brevivitae TaxID=323412 RepID=A0A4Q7PEG2_9FLAO|nr:hypothetical protein [Aquimarina brevivitae]RZS98804.1 hypothetical protein EV197_0004 [Aquimarina brevivitae]